MIFLAEKTNIYALQSENTFNLTNKDDMCKFVGLHILLGCLGLPRIRMYWEAAYKINILLGTMSRFSFFQLRRNVHAVNNIEKPDGCQDKLSKYPF